MSDTDFNLDFLKRLREGDYSKRLEASDPLSQSLNALAEVLQSREDVTILHLDRFEAQLNEYMKGNLSFRNSEKTGDPHFDAISLGLNFLGEGLEETTIDVRQLEQILQSLKGALVVVDEGGRISLVNHAATTMLGYSPEALVGMSITKLLPPSNRDPLPRWLRESAQDLRVVLLDHQQHQITTSLNSSPLRRNDGTVQGMVCMMQDLRLFHELNVEANVLASRQLRSEIELRQSRHRLRSLEAQLRQSQKMEAIGRLAGGIAHDFNNLLTIITSFTHFSRKQLSSEHKVYHDLKHVLDATKRAADLTHQLLTFARRGPASAKRIEAQAQIEKLSKMLVRLLREDISLVLDLPEALWPITVDPTNLDQVLVNLAVNARDAMPEGGKLFIKARNQSVDLALAHQLVLVPGDYVEIQVTDTGVGMDLATQAKVFEPFFTTKASGEGTGLGLATCFGIVKQAAGSLSLESTPGVGSTFKLYFPRSQEAKESTPTQAPSDPLAAKGERVLVVDDSATIRAVAVRTLKEAGYEVLSATRPGHALAMVASGATPCALMVSDVVMPDMNGISLAEAISDRWPKLKVIYMTGYEDTVLQENGVPEDCILRKPFSPNQLLEMVRAALDA